MLWPGVRSCLFLLHRRDSFRWRHSTWKSACIWETGYSSRLSVSGVARERAWTARCHWIDSSPTGMAWVICSMSGMWWHSGISSALPRFPVIVDNDDMQEVIFTSRLLPQMWRRWVPIHARSQRCKLEGESVSALAEESARHIHIRHLRSQSIRIPPPPLKGIEIPPAHWIAVAARMSWCRFRKFHVQSPNGSNPHRPNALLH